MRKLRSISWLVAIVITLVMLAVATGAKAFTAMEDVWPAAITTYRLDPSFSNLGAAWVNRANEAAAHWGSNTIFSFAADGGSANLVRSGNLNCSPSPGTITLANMTPAPTTQGIYRGSFVITVNTNCNLITWYTGTGTPPAGQTDLRTVLRHEFGHAAGLHHVTNNANHLMYPYIDPVQVKNIGVDDQNGMQYLYNSASTIRNTAAYQYWTWFAEYSYDNTHGGVGYKGPGWEHIANCCPMAYNNSMGWSSQTGPTSWLAFQGSRITWKLTKHNNRGISQIYIDGNYMWWHNMDDNNNTLWQVEKTWEVTPGQHIIEVRGIGNNEYTDTDAFIVNVVGQTGTHDSNSTLTIKYLGNWTHCTTCTGADNNTISWSFTTNNSVSIHFYGTGLRYYHTKADDRGIVKVTIDGVFAETRDLYAPFDQFHQLKEYNNLGLGYHQIHFAVTGTKNQASLGYYIDVDEFEVIP